MNSSASNPLQDLRILVLRPQQQVQETAVKLEKLGANVTSHPVIRVVPTEFNQLEPILTQLPNFEWLVLVSRNGSRYFLEALTQLSEITPARDLLQHLKVACIGQPTAKLFQLKSSLDVDLIPECSNSEGLAKALIDRQPEGKLLIPRANRGSKVLADQLTAANIDFVEVSVYQSLDVKQVDPRVHDRLTANEFDWTLVTSSAIAQSAAQLFSEALRFTRLASISPTTSAALRSRGYSPTVEATQHNLDGLIEAIRQFESTH